MPSRRFVFTGFGGAHERVLCAKDRHPPAERTPIVHRAGLARARLLERDRTSRLILLCSGLHEGECEWPSGHAAGTIDEAAEEELRQRAAQAAAAGQP
jgi:hypothetical protein